MANKELNTVAPKKWVQNFAGAAPTIDITDGVNKGDIAVDTSTTLNKVWRCLDNTNSAAIWHEIDMRNFTGVGTSAPADMLHIKGSDTTADAYGQMHNNVYVEAPDAGDGGFWLGTTTKGPIWGLENYRSENAEFLYIYNLFSQKVPFTMNTGGRLGINHPTNIMNYHSWYVNPATGLLNDMDVGGVYTNKVNAEYEIAISTISATDTFKWRKSTNDGDTWGGYSANIAIVNGTDQAIEAGITVNFNAKTGHNTNDVWRFNAHSQIPQGTYTVHPSMYAEVLSTADYTAVTPVWTDVTMNMAWTKAGAIEMPALGTKSAIYIGDYGDFNSFYFVLDSASAGLTLKMEYWNGAWTEITTATHALSDSTANLTVTGVIKWNKATMTDWVKTYPAGRDPVEYNMYWIRVTSTTNVTTAPVVATLSRHSSARLAVYTSSMDTVPSFKVDAQGRTGIGTDSVTGNNQLQVVYPFRTRPSLTSVNSIQEIDSSDSSRAEKVMRLSQATATGVPNLSLAKSRGSLVTPANLATSDWIGQIGFKGYINNAWTPVAGLRSTYLGSGTTAYADLLFGLNNNSTVPETVMKLTRNSVSGNGVMTMMNNATPIGTGIEEFSTDGTMAGDSDLAVPTEKAVKAYIDAMKKYGGMYQTANATATTIVGTGTWAKVLNYTTGGVLSGVTYATSALTVATAGVYRTTGTATVLVGNNADVVEIAIAVDGTPSLKTSVEMKPNNSGVRLNGTATGLLSLTANQVITFMIRNTAGTRNVTVTYSNVVLNRVG